MRIQSAKQKGNELENFVVDELRLSGLDKRAYKQKGSGSGLLKGDIWNDLNLCLECKNQKTFWPKWFEQAEKESLGYQEPVIVWHPPRKPLEASMVFITWDYYKRLLIKSREPPKVNEPTKEVKWKLQQAIQALKSLLNELGE